MGNLICGVNGYEVFELNLIRRKLENKLKQINEQLNNSHVNSLVGNHLRTSEQIKIEITKKQEESKIIQKEINDVDVLVGPVNKYLEQKNKDKKQLVSLQVKLEKLEKKVRTTEFEVREIKAFLEFLKEQKEKVFYAEAMSETIGNLEFNLCPACGKELINKNKDNHCILCNSPFDIEKEHSRYIQIGLDLDIQIRETGHLHLQKETDLTNDKAELRLLKSEYRNSLSLFGTKYIGGSGPRDAFLAKRLTNLGKIQAEIKFLIEYLEEAEKNDKLLAEKKDTEIKLNKVNLELKSAKVFAEERQNTTLKSISKIGVRLLRSDIPRQPEFISASDLTVNFKNDSVSVGGLVNFAESSNVILKNSAIFALFLAACTDEKFFHPRFLLIDNIEDKGLEVKRSHLFQENIVKLATESALPFQVIFTTSMMNPDLELDDYTIGPAYTDKVKTLNYGSL